MSLLLRTRTRASIVLRCYFHGELSNTTELCSLHRRRRGREARRIGEQVRVHGSRSLPLSRMFSSAPHCSLYRPHCQVPFLLPHSSSLRLVQESLLIANPRYPNRSISLFCGVIDDESDCRISSADPKVVDEICKVVGELFEVDLKMEAVLDEIGVDLSLDLVLEVLNRFRDAWKPAFRFFNWAAGKLGFRHGSRTYNSMMSILGNARQFETMVSMLEEMGEKGILTMDTFVIAMKSFAASKERKKAVGLFDLIKKYKFEAGIGTVNCLLDSLGSSELGKEAQAIFERLKCRFELNLETYTVLLRGWWKINKLAEASRVWNEMIDEGFDPGIVVYNVMLEGLLSNNQRSDGIKLFEHMKAKGPSSPNAQSYTVLIRELCRELKMELAVQYYDEMVASRCKTDALVHTSLIADCGKKKKLDVVFGFLEEMKEKGCPPDGRSYNALIELMTVQRSPDDMERVYKKIVEDGVEPTIHTFNMMMKYYLQVRNFKVGGAVWNEISLRGFCPDFNSYTIFIGGACKSGKIIRGLW